MKNIWAVEKKSARAKTSKNLREKFEKVVPCSVSGEKQTRNGHIISGKVLGLKSATPKTLLFFSCLRHSDAMAVFATRSIFYNTKFAVTMHTSS